VSDTRTDAALQGSDHRQAAGERSRLVARIPDGGSDDPDRILDLFLDWVGEIGFELYPAQEEALLEIMAGRHVILSTPTGSGKSLVAQGLHFKAMCEGKTSYYTSPIKALASEKFFSLCDDFGAENVGMLTGDASINPDALILCCTAEVLSNQALRHGQDLEAPYVVMDEFHYYSDRERGVAWQIPLISLPETRFLLMSATLGDMSTITNHLELRTGIEASHVHSDERPVPLDFEYRETPIHETIDALSESGRLPAYIVNFTQRECAELAQNLTSMQLTSKEEKAQIKETIAKARFDTPYGRELRRFLGFGIGVHHAGLLPKYRLLVEQLSQQGLLKVISGTDTLGVGVNIPIRTVLFTRLAKYDGRKISLLKVRDFKQISGRAGRRGFDTQGSVVCQAPEHVIENRVAERKAGSGQKKKRKAPRKQPPPGTVSWTEDTFNKLAARPPERLRSRFKVTSGMILDLLQRDADINDPDAGNFYSVRRLIEQCHDDDASKQRHITHAAQLVRSLNRAGVIRMARDSVSSYLWVVVNEDLQANFSLFHNLSLFLVEAITALDPGQPEYALDLLTLVEAVLEDPTIILRRQVDRIKTELVARLKEEGATYDERIAALDQVTHPQPNADRIAAAFDLFRSAHPWVYADALRPKSVAREMIEEYVSFTDYVRRYGLQRFEGVLLRYLSQLYKTLTQNVPDWAKSDELYDVIGFFRAMIERIDTSLIEEWEGLLHPELRLQGLATDDHTTHRMLVAEELRNDHRALKARVRAELHQLVRALSQQAWDEAALCIQQHPDDPETVWQPERFQAALAPFFDSYQELVFDHQARLGDKTQITKTGQYTWHVVQILVDPAGDNLWCAEGTVDLSDIDRLDGPLIALRRIGS
jgi:superfamily II RNA helicase